MKTVLLCGGFGTRIRDVADDIPKPLIKVGQMPILWHLMSYYASFGYSEFVLCLGYKSETIVDFFRSQSGIVESLGEQPELANVYKFLGLINGVKCDVTMADTGLEAMTGARLRKIKSLIGDETFMLSYGDGLSDVNLEKLVAHHISGKKLLTVTGVRPPSRFGELQVDDKNHVTGFNEKPQASGGRISGG
ncbi:MAG: sugar phosphate nucleotidyltransferase, partial [Acidimicrobiaceae bacterium]